MKEIIKHYTLKYDGSRLSAGGFRAAFLSDMHNCVWHDDPDHLVSLIENEKPDIVLCGGDMVVGNRAFAKDNLEKAGVFLKELSQKIRVYHALGNHEYRLRLYPEKYGSMYEDYMDFLRDSDIVWLDNDKIDLEINRVPVALYGLSISRKFYRRLEAEQLPVGLITQAVGDPDKSRFNILLAHHPRYMGAYFRWGADLVLSGHYHGGIVRLKGNKGLVSPNPSLFPHLAHGFLQKGNRSAIISAGMGDHVVPFRMHNPREIVIFDVEIW